MAKKIKKIKKIQIFRHIVQLIMFFLLPGLYIMAFSGLKSIYQMIIKGNFNFLQAFPSLIEFLSVILVTIISGRFFCGWFCAFGAYNDLIHEISSKIFKVRFKANKQLDSVLKYFKYVVLVSIIVIAWTMGSSIFSSSSPWDAFAQITDFKNVISNLTIGFIFLVLITIGAFFIERFFCRYLCPLGALFTIFSKLSIFKINMPKDSCEKCRACSGNCSMGISLSNVESVRGGECINCLKCVEGCPRKNAKTNISNKNINPTLVSSIAIAIFVAVYGINRLGSAALTSSGITTSVNASASSSKKYKDGTYTGSGSGFRGGTTEVSVTVSSGKITSIKTLSSQDTPDFYSRAEGQITNEIISKQSTSVDTVSGATFSSKGIIDAAKTALDMASSSSTESISSSSQNTASNNNTENSTSSETSESNTSDTENSTTSNSTSTNSSSESSQYKDGTYTGSAEGFRRGTTEVSVTVSSGKITSIKTISTQDTPDFYNRVESEIINEIISKQSTSVDTVSGATFSSRGIINSAANALNNAL